MLNGGALYLRQLSSSRVLDVPWSQREGLCLLKRQTSQKHTAIKTGEDHVHIALNKCLIFFADCLKFLSQFSFSRRIEMIYDSYCLYLLWIWPMFKKKTKNTQIWCILQRMQADSEQTRNLLQLKKAHNEEQGPERCQTDCEMGVTPTQRQLYTVTFNSNHVQLVICSTDINYYSSARFIFVFLLR